jgi:hypothetical protein
MKTLYKIEVSQGTDCGDEFVAWLNEQGHDAEMSSDTGNWVDGSLSDCDDAGNSIINKLWEEFCES